MAREVNQVLWDQWRQRFARQRTSGLSIAAFCREEGVSQAAFFVWKRKLKASVSRRPASGKAVATQRSPNRPLADRRNGGSQSLPQSPTASLRSADFLQLPVHGVRSSPWIELTLVDGTLVRVPHDNLMALTTLLRVLRGDADDRLFSEARHA